MKQSLLVWLFFLTGCTHAPVLLQVYGDADQSQLREKVEDFAEERGLSIERPEVVPATSSAEITIVHSSTYESASTAWELTDLLRALGSDVSLRRVRLRITW